MKEIVKQSLSLAFFFYVLGNMYVFASQPDIELSFFEPAGNRYGAVYSLVVDSTGMPWISGSGGVQFFDGKKFVAVPYSKLRNGRMFGDRERGAYIIQPAKDRTLKNIYKLSDGDFSLVTDVQWENGKSPHMYVSRNGGLYVWDVSTFRVFDGMSWHTHQVDLALNRSTQNLVIVDLGSSVYFYAPRINLVLQVDENREISSNPGPDLVTAAMQQRKHGNPIAAVWAKNHILLYFDSPSELIAFDIRNLKRQSFEGLDELLVGQDPSARVPYFPVSKAMSWNDGSVWLCPHAVMGKYWVIEVSEAGDVTKRQMPLLESLPQQHRAEHIDANQQGRLMAVDNGVVRVLGGKTEHLDWQSGIDEKMRNFQLGKANEIWAATSGGKGRVLRLADGKKAQADFGEAKFWDVVSLVEGAKVLQAGDNSFATFHKERPNAVARWRSGKWSYQDLSVEAMRIDASFTDDQGNVLVEGLFGKSKLEGPIRKRFFFVDSERAEECKDWRGLLEKSMASGARHLRNPAGFSQAIVSGNGKLYFLEKPGGTVSCLDGESWSEIHFPKMIVQIYQTSEGEVLARSDTEKFYLYVDGKVVEREKLSEAKRLMISENGIQPLEKTLIKEHPRQFAPVIQKGRKGWGLMADLPILDAYKAGDDFQGFSDVIDFQSEWVDFGGNLKRWFPALNGGGWLAGASTFELSKFCYGYDLAGVSIDSYPLRSKLLAQISQTKGDLWIVASNNLFRYKQSEVSKQFELANPPKIVGKTLKLKIKSRLEDGAKNFRFYTVVNNKLIMRQEIGDGFVEFKLGHRGRHRCRVVAERFGGLFQIGQEFVVDVK